MKMGRISRKHPREYDSENFMTALKAMMFHRKTSLITV
jgi:hypothetical protein